MCSDYFLKLQIYISYKGDGDMFSRSRRAKERELISDDDWTLIDLLVQDATVTTRRLGSEKRTAEATKRLEENCESEEVIARIKRLAETDF